MLPTKKSIPESDLKKYLIMLYGRPGVGKTTLASQFENPLFFMFEGGAKSLSVYKEPQKGIFTSWKKFVLKIDELQTEKHTFKTVVLDTFARSYDLCQEYVCKKYGVEHPKDVPYGAGWDALKREFRTQLTRITATGVGVIFICHAKEKEIEKLDGSSKVMTAPQMSNQAFEFVNQEVDLLAYYYYSKEKRFIRIRENDEIVAKNRIDGHFTGISKFEVGDSKQTAYKNFLAAFNNQTSPAIPKKTFGMGGIKK